MRDIFVEISELTTLVLLHPVATHQHHTQVSCTAATNQRAASSTRSVMIYSLNLLRQFPRTCFQLQTSPYASIAADSHHVVPLLSHMINDMQPYLWCCNWTSDEQVCRDEFMRVRPSLDIVNYHTPQYGIKPSRMHAINHTCTGFCLQRWRTEIRTS